MSYVGCHCIAIVNNGDGLGDHSTEQVGGAEVHQHQVKGVVHHLCFVPDGGDNHDIEEDADDSQGHIKNNDKSSLVHQSPACDIKSSG